MHVQHIDEFRKLFREFKNTFVDTSQGQEHIGFYERDRQQGTANFRAVEAAFQQQDITSYAQMTDELTELVLRTLLPHSDTSTHRDGGYWIHRAPAIQGDIKDWYGAGGIERDWKAIAHAIFHFLKACIEYPGEKQLQKTCHHFSKLSYTTGFQSGFLTPILNAVNPDRFLLINSKPKKTLTYFSGQRFPTEIVEYPFANKNGKACIQAISPVMRSIENLSLSDADQFDMFCHWLVSIKKFDFKAAAMRYWKIAPGESAWQWDECREQGFIGIGWDELGNLTNLSRETFDARRDELIKTHTGWKKAGVNQVWRFTQVQEGDRIVANRGQSEVVGIGTVTGPYYYEADAEKYKHRLPVEWNDTTPRNIQHLGFKWVPTLIGLSEQEFDAIVQAPKMEQDSSTQTPLVDDKPMQVNPDCPFNLTTFDLLSKLHYTPKKSVYDDHKQDFKSYLEEPFQQLMQEVAVQLPAPIADLMETRSRIFARIPKNDWGQGGAWDFYWGAFYPKGGKRTEDAQLFLWMSYERLECGFYIGQYGSEQRQRFLENCRTYQADLAERLQPTLDREGIVFGSRADTAFRADGIAINRKGIGFSEWIKDPNDSDIHVAAVLSKEQVLSKSQAELSAFIREIYEQVFPLVQLATLEEPMAELQEYLEPAEDVIETHPVYPLAQCAADTSLDEDLLQTWVNAIERKGQAILYGPPGTGKTFLAEHLTRHLLSGGDGFSALVQFHPAYTYEDFIQGIRPKPGKNGSLEYPVEPGRFFKFCEQARTRKDTCVLIIDEINRANLAQVFGELMYLLEYRDKAVELAGGTSFKIPNNVRILGTMNTADRSIALVDHALRRRFAFLPLYPDMSILRKFHAGTGFAVDGLVQILTEVNRAINNRQYELGTSFFLREALSSELPAIWQMEIEPYLEEYFFDRSEQVDKFRWSAIQSQLQL